MGRRRKRREPLYEQTARALGEMLAAMAPGTYLPSEPKLARQMGVSRATLREAMRMFEERGIIVRRPGVGTYVTHPPRVIETGLEVLESIETLARSIGLKVHVGHLEVVERELEPESDLRLDVPAGAQVVEVRRVILAGDRPVAYLIDAVPATLLPPSAIDKDFGGSVLDLLIRRGEVPLDRSRAEVTAISAPAEVARLLQIQRGDALLCLEALLYAVDGRVVDHSFSYFLPGTFRFHIERRIGHRELTPAMPGD